jgi:hypothetical protein
MADQNTSHIQMCDLRTTVSSHMKSHYSCLPFAEVEAADKQPTDGAQNQHAIVERHHEEVHRLASLRQLVLILRLLHIHALTEPISSARLTEPMRSRSSRSNPRVPVPMQLSHFLLPLCHSTIFISHFATINSVILL